MANIAHASMTGTELHEPKGITVAPLGTVYVSNGAGSGSWASVGTSSFTGMISDFIAPLVPTGWLELDGSVISTSTYSGLFAVMSTASSGTRANGSPIVTSIASTAGFKIGYYVFGTGFATNTTIVSVDSATQITLSNNASSSGVAAFNVSPFLMNTGTIQLPDLTTSGRYRRSRTTTTSVGQLQADQNQAHTHTGTGTTDAQGTHTHANTLTDPGHQHQVGSGTGATPIYYHPGVTSGAPTIQIYSPSVGSVGSLNTSINPTGIVLNNAAVGNHGHNVTITTASTGSAEARPLSIVVMTCVKT